MKETRQGLICSVKTILRTRPLKNGVSQYSCASRCEMLPMLQTPRRIFIKLHTGKYSFNVSIIVWNGASYVHAYLLEQDICNRDRSSRSLVSVRTSMVRCGNVIELQVKCGSRHGHFVWNGVNSTHVYQSAQIGSLYQIQVQQSFGSCVNSHIGSVMVLPHCCTPIVVM